MNTLSQFIDRFIPGGFLAHLSTIVGFLLAIFFFARLMSERRAPANTFAWLLVVVFVPWLGVPLYLIFGGRKLRKLVKDKKALFITTSGGVYTPGTPAVEFNFQEPYLRTIFKFIGVTDVRFVTAEGMNQGVDMAAKSRGKAERALDDLAITW